MTARVRLAPVVALLAACGGSAPGSSASTAGKIEHVVVLTMENRSFDHFLGWLPGADGEQAGLTYPDASGALHATHALAPDFQGCLFQDPDHSYQGGHHDGGRREQAEGQPYLVDPVLGQRGRCRQYDGGGATPVYDHRNGGHRKGGLLVLREHRH